MKKNSTVFDVAAAAGVSRGTVDRVVFHRGGVSEKTAEKVRNAIARLNYVPNENASRLATRRVIRFGILIPEFKPGEYWSLIEDGFRQGVGDMPSYKVELLLRHYDSGCRQSFREQAETLLEEDIDAVITNAAPRGPLQDFLDVLQHRHIPFAFIDNKYDDLDYLMYYGVDPYKSGTLGAFLLTMRQKVESVAMVCVKRETEGGYDPNAPRRRGITDYLKAGFPSARIYTLFVDGDSKASTDALMDGFFSAHAGLKHIIFPESRVHLISDWLLRHPDEGRVVVGYDDLEKNMDALRDGAVEFLVTRKVSEQSRRLIVNFTECLIRHTDPARKNNFVHMDILHKCNLDDYL